MVSGQSIESRLAFSPEGCRDRRKLTFYFIADKRIDFRELVRELFRCVSDLAGEETPLISFLFLQGVQDEDLALCSFVERKLRAVKRCAVLYDGLVFRYGSLKRSVC